MQKFYDAVTDFIFVEQEPQKADVIFVPGGNYPEAAAHAAELYHAGFAPYILPSGRFSISQGYFSCSRRPFGCQAGCTELAEEAAAADSKCSISQKGVSSSVICPRYETEAAYLSDILEQAGVPKTAVLTESQATFTYENAIYSRKAADAAGWKVGRAILCCQAFHARRAMMYYQEQFPETEILVCPAVTKNITKQTWMKSQEGIDTVLGEVERCGSQFHEIMKAALLQNGSGEQETEKK